jgi:hypothetical protein
VTQGTTLFGKEKRYGAGNAIDKDLCTMAALKVADGAGWLKS